MALFDALRGGMYMGVPSGNAPQLIKGKLQVLVHLVRMLMQEQHNTEGHYMLTMQLFLQKQQKSIA